LKVICSKKFSIDPEIYWEKAYGSKPKFIQYINIYKRYLKHLKIFNSVRRELSCWSLPSDERFIANRASHYYPAFKIAPLETALRFAFECVPRYCFEKNNHKLPFGCHAWQKYDREFWEPYLLKKIEKL
jgi:hypothetical protein